MFQQVKNKVRKALYRAGVIAFRRSSRIFLPEEEVYSVLARLVADISSPVVIDGGSHKGDMVDRFGELVAGCQFHCFEPTPDLAAFLREKYRLNASVIVNEVALGDAVGTVTLHVNHSLATNSVLPTGENLQEDLRALCKTVGQVKVPLTTIDAYCDGLGMRHVDVIKLDLQGNDFAALQGARKTLATTRAVMVEVLFSEIYSGSGMYYEIVNFLQESGFRLYTLCGLHYGKNDELLWGDALFLKPGGKQRG